MALTLCFCLTYLCFDQHLKYSNISNEIIAHFYVSTIFFLYILVDVVYYVFIAITLIKVLVVWQGKWRKTNYDFFSLQKMVVNEDLSLIFELNIRCFAK